jgi:hypothetical protein
MDRVTLNGGSHVHDFMGDSVQSKANLAYTGGNQPFDNRPLYGIVQYIIYIQN